MFKELLISSVDLLGEILLSGLLIAFSVSGFIAAVKRKRIKDYFISVLFGLGAGLTVFLAFKTCIGLAAFICTTLLFEGFLPSVLSMLFIVFEAVIIMTGMTLSYLFFQAVTEISLDYIENGRVDEKSINATITGFKKLFSAE